VAKSARRTLPVRCAAAIKKRVWIKGGIIAVCTGAVALQSLIALDGLVRDRDRAGLLADFRTAIHWKPCAFVACATGQIVRSVLRIGIKCLGAASGSGFKRYL
jgi:hypothetical protein